MRALAEFIMRGRTQAGIAAFVGNWIPLLTPATVALVTLRHGLTEGLKVLSWGLLPVLVLLLLNQQSVLLAINGVITVFIAAIVLQRTVSLSRTLMALVASNVLCALLLMLLAPAFIAELVQLCIKIFAELQKEDHLGLPIPDTLFVVGLLASITAMSAAAGLVLGRWWQSLLYNPGGFATEFQQLRLSQIQALVCAGAVVYSLLQSASYSMWVPVLAIPLLLAGIALVHAIAVQKRWAKPWLVLFYTALVLSQTLMQLLIVIAFFDVWLDFRGRFAPQNKN